MWILEAPTADLFEYTVGSATRIDRSETYRLGLSLTVGGIAISAALVSQHTPACLFHWKRWNRKYRGGCPQKDQTNKIMDITPHCKPPIRCLAGSVKQDMEEKRTQATYLRKMRIYCRCRRNLLEPAQKSEQHLGIIGIKLSRPATGKRGRTPFGEIVVQ